MAMCGSGRLIALIGLVGLVTGCVGEKGIAPTLRPATTTLGSVRVSPINAIMAVGDTLSLTVTGRTLVDAPVSSFDSVQYVLQDPTDSLRVRMSAAGLVTAIAPSGTSRPVLVEVIAFKDGVARADQAVVQVVATAFGGVTLSIPSSNPKIQWGQSLSIVPIVSNGTQSVAGPTVRYEYGSNDSTKMQCYVPKFVPTATLTEAQLEQTSCGVNRNAGRVGLNQIHAFNTGVAWVYATVTVFGVVLRDSVQYTITNPTTGVIQAGPYYLTANNPGVSDIYIAPGGTMTFYNGFPATLGVSVAFTFDDPSAATAADSPSQYGGMTGNVTPITTAQAQSLRKFLAPGVYGWTGIVSGGVPPYTGATWRGRIIVQ